jgi:hypothetical protein
MPRERGKNRTLPNFLQLTAPVYSREKASSRERKGEEEESRLPQIIYKNIT